MAGFGRGSREKKRIPSSATTGMLSCRSLRKLTPRLISRRGAHEHVRLVAGPAEVVVHGEEVDRARALALDGAAAVEVVGVGGVVVLVAHGHEAARPEGPPRADGVAPLLGLEPVGHAPVHAQVVLGEAVEHGDVHAPARRPAFHAVAERRRVGPREEGPELEAPLLDPEAQRAPAIGALLDPPRRGVADGVRAAAGLLQPVHRLAHGLVAERGAGLDAEQLAHARLLVAGHALEVERLHPALVHRQGEPPRLGVEALGDPHGHEALRLVVQYAGSPPPPRDRGGSGRRAGGGWPSAPPRGRRRTRPRA